MPFVNDVSRNAPVRNTQGLCHCLKATLVWRLLEFNEPCTWSRTQHVCETSTMRSNNNISVIELPALEPDVWQLLIIKNLDVETETLKRGDYLLVVVNSASSAMRSLHQQGSWLVHPRCAFFLLPKLRPHCLVPYHSLGQHLLHAFHGMLVGLEA